MSPAGRKNLTPLITENGALKSIIYVNVIMYLISLLFSGTKMVLSLNPLYAFTPSIEALEFLGASGRYPIIRFEAWWSLITASWLHGGLLHLLFNMLALRTVAPLIMQEFGISRMFAIYTLSGAGGFLLSFIGDVYLTIGASCGLCGLIGAAMYYGKSRGGSWGRLVYKQTTGWVLSLVVFGFFMPNINNWGHAGGFLTGILFGWMFSYNEKRKENRADRFLSLVLGAVTLWLLSSSVIKGLVLIYS